MLADDKKQFLQWLTLLAESFNRKVSSVLLESYWQCLESYPFVQVKQAMLKTLQSPARQKWGMPTPADLIVLIQGDNHQPARKAWSQALTAIRAVGGYDSVVFDNPVIHCVITDMGGWVYLCQQSERELSFLGQAFESRYCDYQGKPLPRYPRSLKGRLEQEHESQGYTHTLPDPILLGNPERALAVYTQGNAQHSQTPLSLSQATQKFSQQRENSVLTKEE